MKRVRPLKGWRLYATVAVLAYPLLLVGFWSIDLKYKYAVFSARMDIPFRQEAIWAALATACLFGYLAYSNRR